MIKIGVSKGRIEKEFYKYLIEKQIIDSMLEKTRCLITRKDLYEFCSVKSTDIINLLVNNCIDIGIVGSDIIEEYNNNQIIELMDVGLGKCYFALETMNNVDLYDINKVATKYPYIASNLLKQINKKIKIIKMDGSLEIAPMLNYADAIIDIVETGETMKANGLVERMKFNNVSTRIVTNRNNENEEVKQLIRKLNRSDKI